MIRQFEIKLKPYSRGFHLIDEEIIRSIGVLPEVGVMHIFIQHTSAGITVNENYDPTVRQDFNNFFNELVPENLSYFKHTLEGADDMPAHIKASMVGFSVTIPITDKRLNMGIWQGIYLCEFRNNGGRRKLIVTIQT